MPRSSTGAYSLPSGTLANTGDVIEVSQHNPAMQDIEQALSASLDRNGRGGMQADLAMNGRKITGLAQGTEPTDAATVAQIGTSGIPLGVALDYWGASAPTDFMFCAGQELSRTEFSDLFAVIGTRGGAGNGSTTFNLPDYRGRTGAGRDDMGGSAANRLTSAASGIDGATVGATGGAQTVTLTEAQMPSHTHPVTGSTNSAGAHSHTVGVGGTLVQVSSGGIFVAGANSSTTGSAGAHSHTISVSAANTGGGQAHPNVQPTVVCNKIMRVR